MPAGVDASSLVDALRRWEGQTADLSPAMSVIAEELVAAVNDEFDTAGRGRWPDLAPSTIAKRRGTSYQILQDTGRLAGSIRADFGTDYAEAATDVSYAVYHVSDQPRRVIPLRDFFDVPDDVYERASLTLVQFIVDQLGAGSV